MVRTLCHLITDLGLGYIEFVTGDERVDSDWSATAQRRLAAEAELLLERDADAAADLARELLEATPPIDDDVAAIGHRIVAVAVLRRGDAADAASHIAESIDAAERSRVPIVLGKALMTAMAVAASTGDPERALALADRAEPLLPADLRVRLAIQRGSVLVAGFSNIDEAIAVFDRVLTESPQLGGFELGILLLNRGTQLLRRGDLPEAANDFSTAAREFRAAGNRHDETASMLHLAMTAARMGDLPTVFTIHRQLTEVDALSSSDPHDFLDLAQCLVIAGLLTEAADLTDRAIELGRQSGVTELSVQVELLAARIQRLLGTSRAHDAWALARASAEAFGNSALLAISAVEGAAGQHDDMRVESGIAELKRAAETLDRAGHRRDALDARIAVLRRELDLGRAERPGATPAGELPGVSADLTPFDRAQLRHLRALRLCLRGDTARARRELLTGIRDIERARAEIAAADVRSAAGDRAPQMAALGLRLAIDAGRPRPVLEWAERVRATALRLANPQRIQEREVRDELDELRRVDVDDPSRAAALERRIANRVRSDRDTAVIARARNASEICATLGAERVLLEYFELDGRLWLCAIERRRVSVRDLDVDVSEVEDYVGKLLFGLRRMASRAGPAAESAASMVDQLAQRLADLILPDRGAAGAELVIVPTGPLHHLPWAALPPLSSRPFVVAPSAHVWCTVAEHPDRGEGLVVATGPGLAEAEREAQQVSDCWPDRSRPLIGVSSVDLRAHLPGSKIAHLCCHGRFRTDSPQFSALELEDGPFTVFDLEGLADLPPLLVLSACSLGSVDVRLGDDLLGIPAALFARGVSTLIASAQPVEDAASREIMVRLHAGLATGASPAVAARDARVAVRGLAPRHAAAAASFTCFGKG